MMTLKFIFFFVLFLVAQLVGFIAGSCCGYGKCLKDYGIEEGEDDA